ncbi:conserved hypothetical protein [Xylella fastidiosa M12]|nr:conserved hypothetical protein [Xylella fastidiosa M12]
MDQYVSLDVVFSEAARLGYLGVQVWPWFFLY